MIINQLVKYCHENYSLKKGQCSLCPNHEFGQCSSKNCSLCFSAMFFNSGRTFNCVNSTYSYVCRYIYQYYSEILFLLRAIKTVFTDNGVQKYEHINVTSIGCGPCSEAFSVNSFFKEINFNGKIVYNGYDLNNQWQNIHAQLKQILPFDLNFIYENCFLHMKSISQEEYPNLLILNYVLSDIYKNGNINEFIESLVDVIIDKMPSRSIIIINDINHYNPRDYYKIIIKKVGLKNNIRCLSASFSGYPYGNIHRSYYSYIPLKQETIQGLIKLYETKFICSSAQLVIYKKSDKQ